MFEKFEGVILLGAIVLGAIFFSKKARSAAGVSNTNAKPYGNPTLVSSSPTEGFLPTSAYPDFNPPHYSGPIVNPVRTPGTPVQTTGPVRFTPAQPVSTPVSIRVGTPGAAPVYSYVPTRFLPGGTYYGLDTRRQPVL